MENPKASSTKHSIIIIERVLPYIIIKSIISITIATIAIIFVIIKGVKFDIGKIVSYYCTIIGCILTIIITVVIVINFIGVGVSYVGFIGNLDLRFHVRLQRSARTTGGDT